MYSIYLYDGDVMIVARYVDSMPSEATVRALMDIRSADRALVGKGMSTIATFTN